MLILIMAKDHPHSTELRKQVRPEHLARLEQLAAENRLRMAGPLLDEEKPSGSLILAEFDSLAEAQLWAEQDPYMQAGVYADVQVLPFKQVLP